jgi:hypothetical protein
MATQALLNTQVDRGKETLSALDGAGLDVRAAFWVFEEDAQAWRFVVAEPTVDIKGPHAVYEVIGRGLQGRNDVLAVREIFVVSPDHQLIALVRMAISTPGTAVSGIWFTGNVINGVNIPDMYIYRMYLPPARP